MTSYYNNPYTVQVRRLEEIAEHFKKLNERQAMAQVHETLSTDINHMATKREKDRLHPEDFMNFIEKTESTINNLVPLPLPERMSGDILKNYEKIRTKLVREWSGVFKKMYRRGLKEGQIQLNLLLEYKRQFLSIIRPFFSEDEFNEIETITSTNILPYNIKQKKSYTQSHQPTSISELTEEVRRQDRPIAPIIEKGVGESDRDVTLRQMKQKLEEIASFAADNYMSELNDKAVNLIYIIDQYSREVKGTPDSDVNVENHINLTFDAIIAIYNKRLAAEDVEKYNYSIIADTFERFKYHYEHLLTKYEYALTYEPTAEGLYYEAEFREPPNIHIFTELFKEIEDKLNNIYNALQQPKKAFDAQQFGEYNADLRDIERKFKMIDSHGEQIKRWFMDIGEEQKIREEEPYNPESIKSISRRKKTARPTSSVREKKPVVSRQTKKAIAESLHEGPEGQEGQEEDIPIPEYSEYMESRARAPVEHRQEQVGHLAPEGFELFEGLEQPVRLEQPESQEESEGQEEPKGQEKEKHMTRRQKERKEATEHYEKLQKYQEEHPEGSGRSGRSSGMRKKNKNSHVSFQRKYNIIKF